MSSSAVPPMTSSERAHVKAAASYTIRAAFGDVWRTLRDHGSETDADTLYAGVYNAREYYNDLVRVCDEHREMLWAADRVWVGKEKWELRIGMAEMEDRAAQFGADLSGLDVTDQYGVGQWERELRTASSASADMEDASAGSGTSAGTERESSGTEDVERALPSMDLESAPLPNVPRGETERNPPCARCAKLKVTCYGRDRSRVCLRCMLQKKKCERIDGRATHAGRSSEIAVSSLLAEHSAAAPTTAEWGAPVGPGSRIASGSWTERLSGAAVGSGEVDVVGSFLGGENAAASRAALRSMIEGRKGEIKALLQMVEAHRQAIAGYEALYTLVRESEVPAEAAVWKGKGRAEER
ncbi:hypothetical protein DFH11DRAFT_1550507 [Phellopilus nigrolimitatus]|nr:hypothetical protein DFH11DRAFT_1550507 [Phellopilus nigrolimitatus]